MNTPFRFSLILSLIEWARPPPGARHLPSIRIQFQGFDP